MKQATTRMLFSYWDGLRGERAAPERGEIEPGEIRHILADTFILELGADRSATVRLAGTRFCALFGGELKGRGFETLWAEKAAREVRRYVDIVVDETAGLVIGLDSKNPRGEGLDLEMILLPLRHRGKPHARILGALAPATLPIWLGLEPIQSLDTVSLRVIWPSGRNHGAHKIPGAAAFSAARRFVVHQGGRT